MFESEGANAHRWNVHKEVRTVILRCTGACVASVDRSGVDLHHGSTGSARRARSPASPLLRLAPTPDPRPAQLDVLAALYHQRARGFAPCKHRDTALAGQENSGSASPRPRLLVEGIGPPRFLDNPNVSMPCSSTSAGQSAPGKHGASMQPSVASRTSAPADTLFRGSITRPADSLSTLHPARCRTRRKTRFRLVANLCRVGVSPTGLHYAISAAFAAFQASRLTWRTEA